MLYLSAPTTRFLNLIFVLFVTPWFLGTSEAQSFDPIDEELGIYCSQLPDGTSLVVNYDPTTGAVSGLALEDVLDSFQKMVVKNKKRLKTLRRLRRRQLPSQSLKTYRTIYRDVFGKKFKGSEERALRSLGKTIRALKRETNKVQTLIDDVKDCENTPPPSDPSAATVQTVSFEFIDPDRGIPVWMSGLAIVLKVSPSDPLAPVCFGFENFGRSTIPVLPDEGSTIPLINPCSAFYPNIFQKRPDCSGELIDGDPLTAVIWLDVSFSPAGPFPIVTEENLLALKNKLGALAIRAYTQQNPC